MINLNRYRDNNGRININLAEDDGLIDIERNPQQSILGARVKYWCLHPNGDFLYKRTLSDNYEDFGEVLGYEFASLIKLPCAEYDFAVFDNEYGVITGDIVQENEELIGGDEILDFVNRKHILPIQKICIEYCKLKNNIKNQEEYIKMLFDLYKSSSIKSQKIDLLQYDYSNNEKLKEYLEEYFDELSILYPYNYVGIKSFEEKENEEIYNEYFRQNGYQLNGWNKKRGVVVSNNLLDIWSLIDNYCAKRGYKYDNNHNIMLSLIRMLIYDMILNQGDRHISNWSIILNKKTKKIHFAPIYDNSKICKLDNSRKDILQKAQSIKVFEINEKKMSSQKKERSIINIERNLRGNVDSKLMIDYNDNIEENDKFTMLEKLVNISSNEVTNIIKDICNKFTLSNILNIFSKVEKQCAIKIPDEVKIVVLKTIELNISKIDIIVKKKEGRRI